jgi:protein-tyrosine phosphatase
MNSILVVCEGNICRSPMAAALLAHALPDAIVASAGLGAMVGMPADPMAVELMQDRGLDITAHRGVQINTGMCQEADLVLVMDVEQRKRLERLYPMAHGRIFRIGEHAGRDVPDPYRQSVAAFRNALALIDDAVGEWVSRISLSQVKS